ERQIGNRRGQRVQNFAHVGPGQKTGDAAAERAGFGNHETYRQAAKVVEHGTTRLIQAMDEGRVSISAASILVDADPDEQETVLELDEKAILQAAREIRQRQTAARTQEQIETEKKARGRLNGKKTWTITGEQTVMKCHLVVADPPYGISDEPW